MQNLQITLKKSTRLTSFCLFLYTLALIVLGLGLFQGWLHPALILIGLCMLIISMHQTANVLLLRKSPNTPTGLAWHEEQGWVITIHGKTFPAKLCGDSVTTSWLLLLHFKTEHHRFRIPIMITKDAVSPDEFRRCHIAIKYGAKNS